MCAYVDVYLCVQCHWMPEEGVRSSGTGVTDSCELLMWVLRTKLRTYTGAANGLHL